MVSKYSLSNSPARKLTKIDFRAFHFCKKYVNLTTADTDSSLFLPPRCRKLLYSITIPTSDSILSPFPKYLTETITVKINQCLPVARNI